MTKKQGKHRNSRNRQTKGSAKPLGMIEFARVSSPLTGLSPAERLEVAQSVAEEARRRFDADFTEVLKGLPSYEPLSMLAYLSFYFLTVESDELPSPPHYPRIMQHHVELLQAMVLSHELNSFAWMPAFPNFVGFLEQLDRAAHAFYVQRMTPQATPELQERHWVQEQMRSHTQSVRNWGYPDQVSRIVAGLFTPLDNRIEEKFGVRVEHLEAMSRRMLAVTGQRVQAHFERLHPIVRAKTVRGVLEAHQRAYPEHVATADGMKRMLEALQLDLPLDRLKELLMDHVNLRLADVYIFSLDDLVAAYPAPVETGKLQAVIHGWTLSFGDLKDKPAEEFFLDNPVWRRPLIRLGDDQYFCPIPGLLQSFVLELMEGLIQDDPKLLSRYQKQRGDYLGAEVERLFIEAFPSAKVYRGSRFHWPDDPTAEYENDLLVVLGSHLIVIEAKAGAVTDPALQGKPKRLESTIRKLLVEPSAQALRFAEFLRQHPGPHQFPTNRTVIHEVDAQEARQIICLGVTLDQVGRVYSRWPALRDAGLVKPDTELVPTLALVDLESIFEVLDGQVQRLHYLIRRGQFERHATYTGGEMDLLALYLDTGFNIGELEFDGSPLMLIGDATRLNPYLMRRTTGATPRRPRLRLTKWWADMVRRVEETQPSHWTNLGVALLDVAYGEQERFEKRFRATRRIVERFWKNPGHEDVIYFGIGPRPHRAVVAGLAVRRLPSAELHDLVSGVADRALEVAAAERGVVIVVDVLLPLYPYLDISYIEGPRTEGSQIPN